MPSFFTSAVALALAGSAIATPWNKRYTPDDACLAAVTGKAALGDDSLRKEHCTSFFKTIVTPAAITVTTTITDAPKPSNWNQWEKKDVTVCPNEVPNYASACDDKGYRSACKAWGVIGETTFTIPATTTTKTVYFGTGKDGVCPAVTVTKTEAGKTSTIAGSTTTVAGSTTTTVLTVTKTDAGKTSTVAGSTTTVAGSTTTTSVTVVVGGSSNSTRTVTAPGNGSATTVTVTAAQTTITVTSAGSTVTVPANGTALTVTVTAGSTVTVPLSVTTSTTTSTTTVTVAAGPGTASPTGSVAAPFTNSTTDPATCLTAARAKEFTDAFQNLLEFTNAGDKPGINFPYNSNISAKYLADDFKDYSDSINWMSGRPLGSVTFKSRAEFDSEQGSGQQPIKVIDQMTTLGCKSITWRWTAITATGGQVTGINNMLISDDLSKMTTNYAEFNSAAWVDSLKNIPIPALASINCKVPDLSGGSGGSSNSTTPQSTSTVVATVTATPTP